MNQHSQPTDEERLAALFDTLRQPARIQILLVIRRQAACVCHLEAALGLRQASISQHLMILRKAGWVAARRESRNIYYSLAEPHLIPLIEQAAAIQGISLADLEAWSRRPLPNCPCPQCHPELPPEYSCRSLPEACAQEAAFSPPVVFSPADSMPPMSFPPPDPPA